MEHQELDELSRRDHSLMGAIFMANGMTREECFRIRIFGLPASKAGFVKRVKAGMMLFLFDHEERHLYGVFEATSDGEMNIVPNAYSSSRMSFPAQIEFKIVWKCKPLKEDEFHDAIRDNYFSPYKFHFGLSREQVVNLLRLFSSKKTCRLPHNESPLPDHCMKRHEIFGPDKVKTIRKSCSVVINEKIGKNRYIAADASKSPRIHENNAISSTCREHLFVNSGRLAVDPPNKFVEVPTAIEPQFTQLTRSMSQNIGTFAGSSLANASSVHRHVHASCLQEQPSAEPLLTHLMNSKSQNIGISAGNSPATAFSFHCHSHPRCVESVDAQPSAVLGIGNPSLGQNLTPYTRSIVDNTVNNLGSQSYLSQPERRIKSLFTDHLDLKSFSRYDFSGASSEPIYNYTRSNLPIVGSSSYYNTKDNIYMPDRELYDPSAPQIDTSRTDILLDRHTDSLSSARGVRSHGRCCEAFELKDSSRNLYYRYGNPSAYAPWLDNENFLHFQRSMLTNPSPLQNKCSSISQEYEGYEGIRDYHLTHSNMSNVNFACSSLQPTDHHRSSEFSPSSLRYKCSSVSQDYQDYEGLRDYRLTHSNMSNVNFASSSLQPTDHDRSSEFSPSSLRYKCSSVAQDYQDYEGIRDHLTHINKSKVNTSGSYTLSPYNGNLVTPQFQRSPQENPSLQNKRSSISQDFEDEGFRDYHLPHSSNSNVNVSCSSLQSEERRERSSVFSRLSILPEAHCLEDEAHDPDTTPSFNQLVDVLFQRSRKWITPRLSPNKFIKTSGNQQVDGTSPMEVRRSDPIVELKPESEPTFSLPFVNFRRRSDSQKVNGETREGMQKRRKLIRPSFGDEDTQTKGYMDGPNVPYFPQEVSSKTLTADDKVEKSPPVGDSVIKDDENSVNGSTKDTS